MKKLFFIIALLFVAEMRSQTLYRYAVGGKSGYMDSTGKTIIKPQYEKAGNFENGLAPVKVGQKYGFINRQNKLVIPATFDYAYAFAGAAAIVVFNDQYGLINKTGAYILKPEYNRIDYPEDGMFMLVKNNRYGFCDAAGKQFVAPVYLSASLFSEGYAKVQLTEHKWGYINKAGQLVIAAKYYGISGQLGDGLIPVYDSSGSYYIDKTGRQAIEKKFGDAHEFSEGIGFVRDKRGEKGYFINKQGIDIFPGKRFKRSWSFKNGHCGAETDSSFVVINKSGTIVFESKTKEFVAYRGKFMVFWDKDLNDYEGLMNEKFEIISELRFCESEMFPKSYMEVRLANKSGNTNIKALINNNGKVLVKWEEEQ